MNQLAAERVGFEAGLCASAISRSLDAIAEALRRSRRPYIAYSGGKDSLVMAHLVHMLAPDVPLVWSDDELEYPETVAHMEARLRAGAPLVVLRSQPASPHAGWFDPWADRPYWRPPWPGALRPTRSNREWMANRGYDLAIIGTRGEESAARGDHVTGRGLVYAASTGLRCNPLGHWSADQVWMAIAGWELPVNVAYGRLRDIGVDRMRQRVGPLPLTPRWILAAGWPDMLARLEARYGRRWS